MITHRINVISALAVSLIVLVSIVSAVLLISPPVGADSPSVQPIGASSDDVPPDIQASPGSLEGITLSAGDYSITRDANGFDVIQMDGFGLYNVPGEPMLPSKIFQFAIPPDAVPSSLNIKIVSVDAEALDGSYDVRPGAVPMAWVDDELVEAWEEGQDIVDGKDMAVYAADGPFPADCVDLSYSQMRKWKYACIEFFPFQYNPVSGELILIESVTIELAYEQSAAEVDPDLLGDAVMDDIAASQLLNYDQAQEWYDAGIVPQAQGDIEPEPQNGTYDYVIITTNAIEGNSSKLASFKSHKEGKGHSVLIVTEDEWGTMTGDPPNHKAEKIRKWLQGNYSSMGIEYVLLIGNPSPYESGEGDIPMKMCWPRINETYPESPTDYFYADLTGDWDYDDDQYYGEYVDDYANAGGGGVNLAVEVYVGRIPVYSANYTALDNILQKTMDYGNESSISWRDTILLPMAFQGDKPPKYDGAQLAEQMKDDYLGSLNYSYWRMYQQGNGTCSLDSSYTSEQELRGGTGVRDRWAANDYGIVCWWGHGSNISAIVGYDPSCNDGNLFYYTYCSALDDDHPSFVYQCSCNNGCPEVSNNLQYSILKQGGVSTVGASRVSWFSYDVPYGNYDDFGNITNSGIGYWYVKGVAQDLPGGKALYYTKQGISPSASAWLMNLYDFNLYGDPATSLAMNGVPVPTPTPTPTATCVWSNITTEDFESGFPGTKWTLYGNPTWDDETYRSHNGSYSGWCAGSTLSPPGPYANSMANWMTYGPFSLASASDAEMNFYYWHSTEPNEDYLWWLVSLDGSQYHGWASDRVSGNSSGWLYESFDLTNTAIGNVCGQSQVWVGYYFYADGDSNTYEGAYVDDIVLRQCVFAAAPTPSPSPTASPSPTPSASPTSSPSLTVTATVSPTASVTASPTVSPTVSPTSSPTASPTVSPTVSPTATPTPTATPLPYGDVNRDSIITTLDMTWLNQILHGSRNGDAIADVNMDGIITTLDITWLNQILHETRTPVSMEETTYDFATGAGSTRWAKRNTVPAPPPALNTTFDTDPTGWVNATSGDYTNISSEDGIVWTIAGAAGNHTALQCKFTVSEGAYAGNITSIGVTFNGTSEISGDLLQMWAWNFNTESWTQVDTDIALGNVSNQGYIRWTTWGKVFADYIDASNYMYILYSHNTSDRDLNIDYVRLEIVSPE